ncbi:hypothetical protein T12_13486 [Trichinella patagoniensis]|uniref:Uncharacterized protein n=1 Tax=Trichinella patagoniensis TaxID=990121 RepID=A0A0V0YYP1_9BILA|nr:hypothetical protein T12_13486 [Trichinella patagoniensis]
MTPEPQSKIKQSIKDQIQRCQIMPRSSICIPSWKLYSETKKGTMGI